MWLVFQVGEKASQLSLSVEVRAGDGARASGPLEELPAFLGSVVVETNKGIAVGWRRGRGGRAHQDVGDGPLRWLAGLVGRLRDPGEGAAASVAFLEGGGLHVSHEGERSGEKERKEKSANASVRRSS